MNRVSVYKQVTCQYITVALSAVEQSVDMHTGVFSFYEKNVSNQ